MRQVRPYKTFRGLERAIDNGGAWFDPLSRKRDGKVTRGELRRASGSRKDPALYLVLASFALGDDDFRRALELVPEETADDVRMLRMFAQHKTIEEVVATCEPGWPVVLHGLLLPPRDPSIVYAQMATNVPGKAWERTVERLDDVYDLWELREKNSRDVPGVFVFFARPRRSKLPEGHVRLAATMRRTELLVSGDQLRYLEPAFYTPLDAEAADDARDDDGILRSALRHRVS